MLSLYFILLTFHHPIIIMPLHLIILLTLPCTTRPLDSGTIYLQKSQTLKSPYPSHCSLTICLKLL